MTGPSNSTGRNNRITRFVTVSIAALVTVITLASAVTSVISVKQRALRAQESARDGQVQGRLVRLVELQKQVELDVVQVQQFLTDVSATRGLNGLNDGWEEAEKNAVAFEKDTAEASSIAKALGADDMASKLATTRQKFQPYYAVGKTMAHAYVDAGPVAGNALMPQFDAASEALSEEVRASSAALVAVRAQIAKADQKEEGDFAAQQSLLVSVAILSTLASIIGGGYVLYTIRSRVLKPITSLSGYMQKLARGEYDQPVPLRASDDELGVMVGVVQDFRLAGIERRDALANRERDQQLAEARARKLSELTAAFSGTLEDVVNGLSRASGELHTEAMELDESSSNASTQAGIADEAAREASVHIQDIAGATLQLRSAVEEIAQRVNDSARIAAEAEVIGQNTGMVVERLSDTARQIEEVTTLISDVASQTNLLALNATIEAARAGAAGQGFAVVAAEVKKLATETARSTETISARISEIQSVSQTTAEGVRAMMGVVSSVREICAALAGAIEEQYATTADISERAKGAAAGADEAARGVAQIADATNIAGQSSRKLLQTSTRVTDATELLRFEAEQFFKSLDAA
jgi:methyl-accepting chemotaxis protein